LWSRGRRLAPLACPSLRGQNFIVDGGITI